MTGAKQTVPTSFGSRGKRGTPEEYQQWARTKDPTSLIAVRKWAQPIIDSGLRSYGGGDPSLALRARIMAVQAIESFDPKKGASLNTHIYNQLQGLQRIRAERAESVHVPEAVRLDSIAIDRYAKSYRDRHGRDPSADAIADALSLSPKRIHKARSVSMEAPEMAFQGESGDVLGSGAKDTEVWRDYVYHDLSDTNKKVFEWATGYRGSARMSKKEIASKLGITSAAVSGRINTIVDRLQEMSSAVPTTA